MAQEQKYKTTDPAKEALKPVAGEMQGVTVPSDVVAPTTLSDRSATPAPAQLPGDDGYTESISALERMRNMLQPVETPEQRAKRERREKSNMTMASVSDGLRALSNLFFTTHDAPDAYHSSQREALERHYDKLRTDRDRNADRYLQYSLRIGNLNAQRAQTQREAEAQAERIKIAQDKARREAEAEKWQKRLRPFLEGKAKAEMDAANAKAREAGIKADNAQGSIDLDNDVKKSTIGRNNAAAGASNASAAQKYHEIVKDTYTFLGKTYSNTENRDRAILEKAAELKIPSEQIVEDMQGNKRRYSIPIKDVEKKIYDALGYSRRAQGANNTANTTSAPTTKSKGQAPHVRNSQNNNSAPKSKGDASYL